MSDDTASTDSGSPDPLASEGLLKKLKDWFRADASHSSEWRARAVKDFDFVTPDGQWSADDRALLADQQRPAITFNRCLVVVKTVAGIEINGRHEIKYLPRGTEDTAVNEVLTAASKWMSDGCDAEDEESEAFQHSVICGMGWTENRLDFEDDPAGKYVEDVVDPLEMFWDRTARKKNLADAKRIWRARQMRRSEAKELFPKADPADLDATWAAGLEKGDRLKTEEERRRKRDENSDAPEDDEEVTIVQGQWWEREPYWLVADPTTNEKLQLGEDEFAVLRDRAKQLGMPLAAVKLTRKVYRQAFIGAKILEEGPAPYPRGFSFRCITGEPDHNARTWFGLVAIMRDPQMWANKWLSQILHIMNSSAKGGIMAETDAFESVRQAEESWARQDRITWAKPGKLHGPQGPKIVPKPQVNMPAGFMQLTELAISSIRDVTGINLELIGMRDVNQPGILEALRKQAAMTVLATTFNSLRRFRIGVGQVRLYFIQQFLSDGRLMRVTGPEGAKAVPLVREKTLGEYDVIVGDAPSSPNQKEANWQVIAPLIPLFKDQLAASPDAMAAILDASPLPSALVEQLKALLMQPNPDADQAKQIAIAGQVADIAKKQADADLSKAKAGGVTATAAYDMALAQNLMAKNNTEVDTTREALEAAHKAAQIEGEQARTAKTVADTEATRAGATHTRVKAAVEALTPIGNAPAQPSDKDGGNV